MNIMNIKEEIIKLSQEIGISKIGFTTADDFAYLEKSLRASQEEGVRQDLNTRILKNVSVPNCR